MKLLFPLIQRSVPRLARGRFKVMVEDELTAKRPERISMGALSVGLVVVCNTALLWPNTTPAAVMEAFRLIA